jgi:ABC-type multidrug transport system ATPase subunit
MLLTRPTNRLHSPMLQQSQNPLYYLENVSVTFGHIEALKSVQLSVEKGEIIFLTGASGAGKTSLLRLLAGDLAPTSGRILFGSGGRGIFTAQVFQELRLLMNKTGEQNLLTAYDPEIYVSYDEFLRDMNDLCRALGIADRLELLMKDANGGLKQKIAIIRALLTRPDVLLADEPTSSLDLDNANKLFELLNLYNLRKGLTIIWASHNSELVKRFSGKIIHLDGGRLVYSGHACFI